MHVLFIIRVFGILLLIFSGVLLLSAGVGFIYGESLAKWFATTGMICLTIGLLTQLVTKRHDILRKREGFLITSLSYIGLGLLSALPFWLFLTDAPSFTNAAFEAISGLTTTGATVFVGLDSMEKSLLFYRQILQWIGGMGIILLAVAILPMLGIGGMQLFRAESSDAVQTYNLRPRLKETAATLWLLYLLLTLACFAAYWLSGMSVFDAICHAFSTIAIGGFSTHDASIGYFENPVIEWITIFFLLVAGANFALHYTAWRRSLSTLRDRLRDVIRRHSTRPRMRHGFWRDYSRDFEFRLYIVIVVVLVILVNAKLAVSMEDSEYSFRAATFQAVSFVTTSGYTTTSVDTWPVACAFLVILAAFFGGCVGSTAGGIKIMRVLILGQSGIRELYRLIFPNGVFHVRLHDTTVTDRAVEAVWGFAAVYVAVFFTLLGLTLLISDLDLTTAFSAVAACLNNLGPGIGGVADNYLSLSDSVKWVLIAAMLLGRLEIFTLFILFVPKFWRS